MKIRFVKTPEGGRKADFKVGDELDLVGPINEGYARKYIDRGWAEEVKPEPVAASAEEKAYEAEAVEVVAQVQARRDDRSFRNKR